MNGLSNFHKMLLTTILADQAILAHFRVGEEVAKDFELVDNKIRFYSKKKTWIRKLVGDYSEASFTELAIAMTNILGGERALENKAIKSGLKEELLKTLFGDAKEQLIEAWMLVKLLESPFITDKPDINEYAIPIQLVGRNGKYEKVLFSLRDFCVKK